jgi:hypothetical protein
LPGVFATSRPSCKSRRVRCDARRARMRVSSFAMNN